MFLSPWMLYGLGALSVPILIHLWQRRRVVQVPFSTLRYLKIVAARTSRTSKIENLLLLLLRCALFALLVLATARPIILAKTARLFGGDVPRTVVLIVDNSASMAWRSRSQDDKTRLDLAKTAALAVFDDLKPGDRVAVIASNDRADLLVAEPTIDRAVARSAVEGVRQTQARGDLAPALREARKIAARAERGIHELFLFTDSQESGWRPVLNRPASVFDDAWKIADLHLTTVRPDDLPAGNAAVTRVVVSTPFLLPGSTINGIATVENHSTTALHDLVEIQVNGERMTQRPVDAPPNGSVDVQFAFSAPSASGRWAKAVAKLSGDGLTADDTFHFTMPVYQQPRVVLVEGQTIGPERLRAGFFLRKALSAGPNGGVAGSAGVRSISTAQLDEFPLENLTAIFLTDPGHLSDRSVVRLGRFLEAGGTVVLFPGDQTSLDDLKNADFLPAKPLGLRTLGAGRQPAKIIEPAHPLFADAWDTNTPFPALPQQKTIDWKIAPETKVLLTVGASGGGSSPAGGLPFILECQRQAGRVLIINASADRSWGDFPLSPAFLPLVQQIARVSSAMVGRHVQFSVGDPLPMPPGLPLDQALRITFPDGSTRTVPPVGSNRQLLERAEMPGIYAVASPDQTAFFAVNLDRAESDLHPVPTADLDKLGESAGGLKQLVGVEALRQALAQNRGLAPLWPLLLCIALLVFAAEAVLANVMARRRAQGDEQHIKTGRLNRRRMGVPFYAPTANEGEVKA